VRIKIEINSIEELRQLLQMDASLAPRPNKVAWATTPEPEAEKLPVEKPKAEKPPVEKPKAKRGRPPKAEAVEKAEVDEG